MKICRVCREHKHSEEFHTRADSKDGLRSDCKQCVYIRNNQKYRENEAFRLDVIRRSKEWAKANPIADETKRIRYRKNRKLDALAHYGDVCQCCGESNELMLNIDHIESNGAAHRKEINNSNIYTYLKKSGFPPGYRVLCFNCNFAIYHNNGVCPHVVGVEG